MNLVLKRTEKSNDIAKRCMEIHYSKPKGFVGRQLLYLVMWNLDCYGMIAGGSATLHLKGRETVLGGISLDSVVNNIFFHVEKQNGEYPIRNFTVAVLREWKEKVARQWEIYYGPKVLGFESLVELPRTGELYKRTIIGLRLE